MEPLKFFFFFLVMWLFLFEAEAQKLELEIDTDIMRCVYFDGVTMSSILNNQKLQRLTVTEDKEDKTIYKISRSDTLIVLSVFTEEDADLIPQYQVTFDTVFEVVENRQFYNSDYYELSEEIVYYDQKMMGDERHKTRVSYEILKDGSLSTPDTVVTISSYLDFAGRPSAVLYKERVGGDWQERNEYYLYEYDEHQRLTESRKYGDDQNLKEIISCEYLDEEGLVKLNIDGSRFELYYKDGKLVRSEVYGATSLRHYRLYKYNAKGRLIKMTQFDGDSELQETYEYKYN